MLTAYTTHDEKYFVYLFKHYRPWYRAAVRDGQRQVYWYGGRGRVVRRRPSVRLALVLVIGHETRARKSVDCQYHVPGTAFHHLGTDDGSCRPEHPRYKPYGHVRSCHHYTMATI